MILHHDKQHQIVGGLAATATPEWMLSAVCAQTDPEIFFPEKGSSNRSAKAICSRCPVKAECLELALDQGEQYGIYGGLSEVERRKLTRHRADYTHVCVDCQARFRTSLSLSGHRSSCTRKRSAA